jgi:hypothetical protein
VAAGTYDTRAPETFSACSFFGIWALIKFWLCCHHQQAKALFSSGLAIELVVIFQRGAWDHQQTKAFWFWPGR